MSMLGGFAVQADEGEKVVINFYEHSDSDVIAEDLVEAYNVSQGKVEVKLSLISNDDYDDKVKVMLAWIIPAGSDLGSDQYADLCKQVAVDGKQGGLRLCQAEISGPG